MAEPQPAPENKPQEDQQKEEKSIAPKDYAKLERLLKAGQWEEADYETYVVMLRAVGKDLEEGGLTRWDAAIGLSDEVLLTIDQLWVQSSNGHFGFSVQKDIWQKCGSPMRGGQDWDRFCYKVGWRLKGKFMDYNDLKKDLSLSPAGELPMDDGTYIRCGLIYTILSRLSALQL